MKNTKRIMMAAALVCGISAFAACANDGMNGSTTNTTGNRNNMTSGATTDDHDLSDLGNPGTVAIHLLHVADL